MKRSLTLLAALFLSATVAAAGAEPQSGNILSHTSVECGTKKSKKQDIDLLCQQYVVRSGTIDYTIRQPKPSEQAIIPLKTAIEFKLDKNKMKFKVDGKSFEFMVISQAAVSSPDAAPASSTPNDQQFVRAVSEGEEQCLGGATPALNRKSKNSSAKLNSC